jgi:phosphate-selective porin OprO and OprP
MEVRHSAKVVGVNVYFCGGIAIMRKSLIIAAALLLAPAISQAKSLEDLLVEKGVITKAEATSATNSSATKVYWNNGTRFEFPDNGFTAGFATQLQERYTFTDYSEEGGQKNTSSFETIRARLDITGTALHNEFAYRLMPEFAGSSASLRDAYIQWNACDWAELKMGQYKTFLSRQYNSPSWKLLFPDRSLASDAFAWGRNPGLSGAWFTDDKMFVVKAGIFNGTSDGEGMNRPGVDTRHLGVISARVNPIGKIDAYDETDVDYTDDFAMSAGLTYGYGESANKLVENGPQVKVDDQRLSVDTIMKVQGLSLAGEFFWADLKPKGADDSANPLGFYVQAGYFLMPKKFEVAARYSYLDCDNGKGCTGSVYTNGEGIDQINEVTVALNYYFWKNNLKAALAWNFDNEQYINDNKDNNNTNRWMFQVSSYF